MTSYRWNAQAAAAQYDAAAEYIHPHYLELQDQILEQLAEAAGEHFVVLDAGGGTGRLMERVLDLLPQAEGIVLDQSESCLEFAQGRLEQFGARASVIKRRLQDDWQTSLPGPVDAIISMSAIHHLDPTEKQTFYAKCYDCLSPSGRLLNGDEILLKTDEQQLTELHHWDAHMTMHHSLGNIPANFSEMIDKWRQRNITDFGSPKQSGDDCHETLETHLGYLESVGFQSTDCPWEKGLWALMVAEKKN